MGSVTFVLEEPRTLTKEKGPCTHEVSTFQPGPCWQKGAPGILCCGSGEEGYFSILDPENQSATNSVWMPPFSLPWSAWG